MNNTPRRNSYLRSEIETFARTLAMLSGSMTDERYRLGWLEALAAMSSLAGIDLASHDAARITQHDERRLLP